MLESTQFDDSDYFNIRVVARRLGIHEESLRRIIRIGTLPAAKIGGQWYVDKDRFHIFAATYNPKTGKRRRLI